MSYAAQVTLCTFESYPQVAYALICMALSYVAVNFTLDAWLDVVVIDAGVKCGGGMNCNNPPHLMHSVLKQRLLHQPKWPRADAYSHWQQLSNWKIRARTHTHCTVCIIGCHQLHVLGISTHFEAIERSGRIPAFGLLLSKKLVFYRDSVRFYQQLAVLCLKLASCRKPYYFEQ